MRYDILKSLLLIIIITMASFLNFRSFPFILVFLSYFIIGLYFYIPNIIKNLSEGRKISFNINKILTFGIPLLLLIIYPYLFIHGIGLPAKNNILLVLSSTSIAKDISSIMLGVITGKSIKVTDVEL